MAAPVLDNNKMRLTPITVSRVLLPVSLASDSALIDELRKQIAELKTAYRTVKSKYKAEKVQEKANQIEINELNELVKELSMTSEQQVSTLAMEKEALEKDLVTAKETIRSLSLELQNAKKKLSDLGTQNHQLAEENSLLRQLLTKKEGELQSLRSLLSSNPSTTSSSSSSSSSGSTSSASGTGTGVHSLKSTFRSSHISPSLTIRSLRARNYLAIANTVPHHQE